MFRLRWLTSGCRVVVWCSGLRQVTPVGRAAMPIFTAMKLLEREIGRHHVSCDIGCHLFSILPPFDMGATTMG